MTGDTPPVPLASEELPPLGRVRLGVPRPYFFDVLDEDVRHQFETALSRLARAGCRIADVTIPHARYTMPIYLHVQLAEAATYHARTLETRAADYTPEVRARLELGRYVLAEDYLRAQRGRAVLQADVDRALAEYDALALPTLAIAAPPLGQPQVKIGDRIESTRTVMLRLTQAFNLTGHPALSLPCGWTREGLPCGLQLVGRRHGTAELVRLALACEGVVSSQGGESRSQALA